MRSNGADETDPPSDTTEASGGAAGSTDVSNTDAAAGTAANGSDAGGSADGAGGGSRLLSIPGGGSRLRSNPPAAAAAAATAAAAVSKLLSIPGADTGSIAWSGAGAAVIEPPESDFFTCSSCSADAGSASRKSSRSFAESARLFVSEPALVPVPASEYDGESTELLG